MQGEAVTLERRAGMALFRQLATHLRYRMAVGELVAGDPLPSLRDGQERWGVSLHTVRRAYQLLEQEGLVETRDRAGTRVTDPGGGGIGGGKGAEASFVEWVLRVWRARYGLDAARLARLIESRGGADESRVLVVECSGWLASRLASQVSERWGVEAIPCLVRDLSSAHPLPVIATLYHARDVLAVTESWGVAAEFLTVELDPEYVGRVRDLLDGGGSHVVLCGVEPETTGAMAHDLARQLEGARIEVYFGAEAEEIVAQTPSDVPVVLSPEQWDTLPVGDRDRPNVFGHRSRFRPGALEELGARMGWMAAETSLGSAAR